MEKIIPNVCPHCKDLKNWKRRSDFGNIKEGSEFGYHLCELKPWKALRYTPPSEWIYGQWLCFEGKYLDCPLFSEWFWKQVIKNNKIKIKKKSPKNISQNKRE